MIPLRLKSRDAVRPLRVSGAGTLTTAGLGAALLMAVSCGDGTAGGDTPHVDDLPRLTVVEELRLGSVDDPESGFSSIGGVQADDDGTVYVLESEANEVRVFAPDGRRLRTVGRSGEGPGEFRSPTSFGLLADTLWVFDLSGFRLSWFGPDGSFLFSTPGSGTAVEVEGGRTLRLVPYRPLPDGRIESTALQPSSTQAYQVPVVAFDRDGRVVDTLRWEEYRPSVAPTVRIDGREINVPGLGPSNPWIRTLDGDSLVLRWSVSEAGEGALQVAQIAAGGDTLVERGLRYTPVPVPGSVRDSLLDGPVRALPMVLGVSEAEVERVLGGAIELPAFRPPIRDLEVGADGGLWLELNTASTDSATWVVLGADGAPRGRVTLPVDTNLELIAGSTVWAVEPDELDVPWLVRFRVE